MRPGRRGKILDQQRAGKEHADKRLGNPGDHQQHRIAETRWPIQHAAFAQALSCRRVTTYWRVISLRNEFLVRMVKVANPPITSDVTGNTRCQK